MGNGEVRATKARMLFDKQEKRHSELQGEFDSLSHEIKRLMSLLQRQQNEMAEYAKMEEMRIEADKAKEQLDADLGEEQEAVEIEHEIFDDVGEDYGDAEEQNDDDTNNEEDNDDQHTELEAIEEDQN